VDAAGNLYVGDYRIQKRDAHGVWSIIATDGTSLGQGGYVIALAADAAGGLYYADNGGLSGRVLRRDLQGKWSIVSATYGDAAGQVMGPSALAVDAAGALYVTERGQADGSGNLVGGNRIEKRDAQGHWALLRGQVPDPLSLALDADGSIYAAAYIGLNGLIEKRDSLGNWSVLATVAPLPEDLLDRRYLRPVHLAVDQADNLYAVVDNSSVQVRDTKGNWTDISPGSGVCSPAAGALGSGGDLYVIDNCTGLQKRDAQGNWTVIDGNLPFDNPSAMVVDGAGDIYVASSDDGQIHRRDAQGKWTVFADHGSAVGQVGVVTGLAVDAAGNLYVADPDNNRVQMYTLHP
jgi:DNA-binding beta-propeller fold protein YncE